MKTSLPPRLFSAVALRITLTIAAFWIPSAFSFELGPHEQIMRTSLGSRIASSTLIQDIGGIASRTGNLGSDTYQADAFRHFDNAPDPGTVCTRANAAWQRFYAEIRDSVQPNNAPQYDKITGIDKARSAFGALTHALQDFYAHSNWIELHVALGQSAPLALSLFPNCTASSLPTGLQTGYFELNFLDSGILGCPTPNGTLTPPPGYSYCHATLNKDSNQTRQGGAVIPHTTTTYHAEAARLASAHTDMLFNKVVAHLQADWKARHPNVRSECIAGRVMVEDVAQPCRFPKLKLINDSRNETRLAGGTVTARDAVGAIAFSKSISKDSWPVPVIDLPVCLPGLTVEWQFDVDDSSAPQIVLPTARKVSGALEFTGGDCGDREIKIVPEEKLTYLVQFTNADTKLSGFTNVITTVNKGLNSERYVTHGPIAAGITMWLDLGSCSTVANFDFTYYFFDPSQGRERRASPVPDEPPNYAAPGCIDQFRIDFGGQFLP